MKNRIFMYLFIFTLLLVIFQFMNSKRIIEDYHKGKIKVIESEIGKGTTIQIALKAI